MTQPNTEAGDEPAFPATGLKRTNGIHGPGFREWVEPIASGGITKREYFAAKAMQALIAREHGKGENLQHTTVALTAISYADALLAQLKGGAK